MIMATKTKKRKAVKKVVKKTINGNKKYFKASELSKAMTAAKERKQNYYQLGEDLIFVGTKSEKDRIMAKFKKSSAKDVGKISKASTPKEHRPKKTDLYPNRGW